LRREEEVVTTQFISCPPMGNLLTSTAEVDRLVASQPVVMFSATYCSYCTLAKRILNDLGTDFLTVEVNKHPEGRKIAEELSVVTKTNYVSSTCSLFIPIVGPLLYMICRYYMTYLFSSR
jgi:glutaredoxin 3